MLILKGSLMKFLIKFLATVLLTIAAAQAACPPYAPYNCVPGPNGKQICGCGR